MSVVEVLLRLMQAALVQQRAIEWSYSTLGRSQMNSVRNWFGSVVVKIGFLATPRRIRFEKSILHGRPTG